MKIAHVLTRFSPEENPGGVERVVEEVAKRQSEEHEVEAICRNQFEDSSEENYKGIKVRRAGTLNFSGLRTLSSLLSMRDLIRNSDADVFHIHDWSPYINYLAAGFPKKSVITLHNRESGKTKKIQDIMVARSDAVTCVSQDIQDRMKNEAAVISNGVDLEQFVPKKPEDYFVFVGNLLENKGVDELCSVWKESWPKLKIAGSGPEEKKIPDQKNIQQLGRLSHSRMPELIGNSKGLVLPSRTEGFGLVWAEALACGKPLLYTNTGLGAEIPEYCGVKIESEFGLKQLEESIEKLMNQEFDSHEIRNYAERKFSWNRITNSYLDIYKDI